MPASASAALGASTAESDRTALAALSALGQPTRLDVFRLLMQREPEGLSAGAIAEAVGCPRNTLSAHLAILARAGLVRGRREGRSIIYRAELPFMRTLIEFLVIDCCHGRPELCGFLAPTPDDDCGCASSEGASKRGHAPDIGFGAAAKLERGEN